MENTPIPLRPHHIYLIARIVSGHFGEPERERMLKYFGHAMTERCKSIAKQIAEIPATPIKITKGDDTLCGICRLHEECKKGNIELIREALSLTGRVKYKNAQELDDRVMKIYNKCRPKDNPFIYGKEYEAREFPRI